MKLALLFALPLLASAQAPPWMPPPPQSDTIMLVNCGTSLGTAFRVSPDTIVSAAHVTSKGPCYVSGSRATTIEEDGNNDFARLSYAGSKGLSISCNGPRPGKVYYSIGYALGQYRIVSRLVALGKDSNGLIAFSGGVIPGMSGGPIIDESGKVVALTNMTNPSIARALGRSLAETSLCGRSG